MPRTKGNRLSFLLLIPLKFCSSHSSVKQGKKEKNETGKFHKAEFKTDLVTVAINHAADNDDDKNNYENMTMIFSSLAQQPNAGQGRLIFEVSRSHTMTHRSQ
jgi:hypothetical protein